MTTTGSKAANVVVCPDWEGGDSLDLYHTIGKCAVCRNPWNGFNASCPEDGTHLGVPNWWCSQCEDYPEPFLYHDGWFRWIRFCPRHFTQLRTVSVCPECAGRFDVEQGAVDAGFSSDWYRRYALKEMELIAVTPEFLRSLQGDEEVDEEG